nr:hypothetical protein CFP56_09393 [Quercus suber]
MHLVNGDGCKTSQHYYKIRRGRRCIASLSCMMTQIIEHCEICRESARHHSHEHSMNYAEQSPNLARPAAGVKVLLTTILTSNPHQRALASPSEVDHATRCEFREYKPRGGSSGSPTRTGPLLSKRLVAFSCFQTVFLACLGVRYDDRENVPRKLPLTILDELQHVIRVMMFGELQPTYDPTSLISSVHKPLTRPPLLTPQISPHYIGEAALVRVLDKSHVPAALTIFVDNGSHIMDDQTFQRELQQVKRRVSMMRDRHQLSSCLHPTTASPMQPQTISDVHDIFTAQMSTIQTQLAALKANVLSGLNSPGPLDSEGQDAATATTRATYVKSPPEADAKFRIVASPQDVQGLDQRVTSLEHTIAGLQDDLESLNRHRYTPSCSVNSFADCFPGLGRHEPATTGLSPFRTPMEDSARHNVDVSLQLRKTRDPAEQVSSQPSSPIPSTSINDYTKNFLVRDMLTEEREGGKQINGSREAMDVAQGTTQSSSPDGYPIGSGGYHDHLMILECATNISAVRDNLSGTRELLYQHIQNFQQQHHKDITDLYKQITEMQRTFDSRLQQKQLQSCINNSPLSGLDGVNSYEKEMARLNELWCNAPDKLKSMEHHALDKDETPIVPASKHEPREVPKNSMLPNTMQNHQASNSPQIDLATTAAYIRGIDSMLNVSQGPVEAWRRSYRNLEQEIRDCRSERDDAVQQVQRLTIMLRDAEDREREFTANRTHEINGLHELCKKKDNIVSQLEGSIVRGATLLEQRDTKVKDLTKQLFEAENDRDDGKVRLGTMTDLLKGTNKTLRAMKLQTIEICERPKTLTGFGTVVTDLQHRLKDIGRIMADSPSMGEPSSGRGESAIVSAGERRGPDAMSITSHVSRSSKPSKVPKMWSPQPLVGRSSLADEARRASVWASNYSPPVPVFGQPGMIGFPGVEKRRSACAETTNGQGQYEGGPCGVRGPTDARTSSECVHPPPQLKREHQQNAGQAEDRESKPRGSHADEEVTAQATGTNADASTRQAVRLHAQQGNQHYHHAPAVSSSAPSSGYSQLVRPWVSQTARRSKQLDADHLRPRLHEPPTPGAATVESDPDSKGGE